jgi:hypothetical protein
MPFTHSESAPRLSTEQVLPSPLRAPALQQSPMQGLFLHQSSSLPQPICTGGIMHFVIASAGKKPRVGEESRAWGVQTSLPPCMRAKWERGRRESPTSPLPHSPTPRLSHSPTPRLPPGAGTSQASGIFSNTVMEGYFREPRKTSMQ